MSNLEKIAKSKSFWQFFINQGEIIEDQGFSEDFGENIVIDLTCPEDYVFRLSIYFDIFTSNLALHHCSTDTSYTMGWWDEFRWHPYCLRWKELQLLTSYWQAEYFDTSLANAAFLLLCPFVGIGDSQRNTYQGQIEIVREQLDGLRLFSKEEVNQLSSQALIMPSNEDYEWKKDEAYGWLFSGKYPCYSIRNLEHEDGSEGRFPFEDWKKIISILQM